MLARLGTLNKDELGTVLKMLETVIGEMIEMRAALVEARTGHADNSKPKKTRNNFRQFHTGIRLLRHVVSDIDVALVEYRTNRDLERRVKHSGDSGFAEKKKIVGVIGRALESAGAHLLNPSTGEPANIYANASPDGKGRYLYEDKKTKKRSNSSDTILKLLPLHFATIVPGDADEDDDEDGVPESKGSINE